MAVCGIREKRMQNDHLYARELENPVEIKGLVLMQSLVQIHVGKLKDLCKKT